MRRSFSWLLLVTFALAAPAVKADTIYLKNGSVLKGKVASFADDQFIVMLDAGGGRFLSRAMIFTGDVARIEFDSASGMAEATSRPSEAPRDVEKRETPPPTVEPRVRIETPPREVPRVEPTPDQPARQPEPEPVVKDPPVEKPTVEAQPPVDTAEAERAARKLAGPVRTQNVDVAAKRDWTSTGIIVKRGDRVRITATGSITLDQTTGRSTGPEGIDLPDTRKLMTDQPTGALIAVIGADNDDFIFVGKSAEFSAARDGLLFLSVNEGALSDNSGVYKAVIEVQSQRK